MKKKLENQVALVTGAGRGIGAGIAGALADEGATVVVNYHSAPSRAKADELCAQITRKEGKAIAYQADVSNETEVRNLFAKIVAELGGLDILVNNAGIQADAPLTEMTLEQWNKVIGVNLTGQFLCSREAAKIFLQQEHNKDKSVSAGKIICISSVHQVIPWAGHVNYAASKGGIKMMMETMAQELAPYKIRVNSIAPGAIKTDINKAAWSTAEAEKKLLTLIPYGRVGEPSDIGKAAVWLASDDSDYITGTTLFIDGGMCLYPGFAGNG